MALFSMETPMARAHGVHHHIPPHLHGVQVHSHPGAPDAAGEADQVVQTQIIRYCHLIAHIHMFSPYTGSNDLLTPVTL